MSLFDRVTEDDALLEAGRETGTVTVPLGKSLKITAGPRPHSFKAKGSIKGAVLTFWPTQVGPTSGNPVFVHVGRQKAEDESHDGDELTEGRDSSTMKIVAYLEDEVRQLKSALKAHKDYTLEYYKPASGKWMFIVRRNGDPIHTGKLDVAGASRQILYDVKKRR
jgi:hypothetical protein